MRLPGKGGLISIGLPLHLHLKLLQMIPDRHMVKFIMEMLYNRSFMLNTSDGQCSRQRRLKNGVPQGSVLAPMLCNVYIHDLPVTQAKKYGYADDLAILLQKKSWEDIEEEEEEEEYFYLTLNKHYTNTGHHGNP